MGVLGVRVRVNAPEHEVLVVLTEADGDLCLPIVIGPHEGVAIATAHAGMSMPRPGPHDLLLRTLEALDVQLSHVAIVELREGTFIAELVLSNGERIDSRASDAIALALRGEVEVWCAEEVLEAAGVELELDEDDQRHIRLVGQMSQEDADQRVAEFRDFLDRVDPEDFSSSGGSSEG